MNIGSVKKDLKSFYEDFRSSLTASQLKKFKSLKSNDKKILFVVNAENCLPYPVRAEINHGKSLEEATNLKNEGNIEFQNGNYEKALWFYSQAIKKSSLNSTGAEEAVILFANRSASLYHLKEYELAIRDIDFAFKNKYPKELSHKILDRKARCFLALKKHDSAKTIFRLTIKALDESKLTMEKKQKWQKDIQIMLLMLEKNHQNVTPAMDTTKKSKKEIYNNPMNKAFRADIDIKFSSKMGRFAEAKSNIKTGDVVLEENAHCAVLLETCRSTHCHHCLKRVKVLYPCQTCDRVIYCSEECAEIATSTYHKTECTTLGTLWEANVSITCLLALRMITQQQLKFFLKRKNHTNKVNRNQTAAEYDSSNYETICNLVSHENQRTPENMIHRIHTALFLAHCLQKTAYFQDDDTTTQPNSNGSKKISFTPNELYVAQLLLHHLQILQFNAHEVSELVIPLGNTTAPVSKFIGGALYPTLALFNHSCNPGVIRYFHGTRVVVRAIRNISAGEMVAENYGPIFMTSPKEERQQLMRERYWFNCECEACLHDWPTLTEIDNSDLRLRCANAKCHGSIKIDQSNDKFFIKCKLCLENNNIMKPLRVLQETDEMFKKAKNWMKSNSIDQALKEFLKIFNLLDKTLELPSKDYHICQNEIRTCYLWMGNRVELKKGIE